MLDTTTIPAAAAVPAPPKPALKPLRFASSLPAPPKPAAPARAPVAQPLKSALRAPGAPPRAPRNVSLPSHHLFTSSHRSKLWIGDLGLAVRSCPGSALFPGSRLRRRSRPGSCLCRRLLRLGCWLSPPAPLWLRLCPRLCRCRCLRLGCWLSPPPPLWLRRCSAPASPPVAVPASPPAATPAVVSAASFGVSPPPSMEGLEMTLEDWEREGRETMARIRANGPFVGQYKYVFRSLSSSSSASSTSSRGPSSSSASSSPPSDDHSSSWTPRALASLPSAAAAPPADSSKLPTRESAAELLARFRED